MGSGATLIGCSGFLGETLLRQSAGFTRLYRSTNISSIGQDAHDLVVCVGAPGAKWLANRDPAADAASLRSLTNALRGLRCKRFLLVSTVDVYAEPVGVDESTPVAERGRCAYGKHRLALEQFVLDEFPSAVIVRLPGLVGAGLRKNALFDLKHRNGVERLDGRAVYQFYPTSRLWSDLQLVLASGLRLVHLVAEPMCLGTVAQEVFGVALAAGEGTSARYDVRSIHCAPFGVQAPWQVSAAESLRAIQEYAR